MIHWAILERILMVKLMDLTRYRIDSPKITGL